MLVFNHFLKLTLSVTLQLGVLFIDTSFRSKIGIVGIVREVRNRKLESGRKVGEHKYDRKRSLHYMQKGKELTLPILHEKHLKYGPGAPE